MAGLLPSCSPSGAWVLYSRQWNEQRSRNEQPETSGSLSIPYHTHEAQPRVSWKGHGASKRHGSRVRTKGNPVCSVSAPDAPARDRRVCTKQATTGNKKPETLYSLLFRYTQSSTCRSYGARDCLDETLLYTCRPYGAQSLCLGSCSLCLHLVSCFLHSCPLLLALSCLCLVSCAFIP